METAVSQGGDRIEKNLRCGKVVDHTQNDRVIYVYHCDAFHPVILEDGGQNKIFGEGRRDINIHKVDIIF